MQEKLDSIKKNATQFTARLKALGVTVSNSQVLEGMAAAQGYRTWHAYKASLETPAPGTITPIPAVLLSAIEDVVNSADNTGCDGLTVVSQDVTDTLETLFDDYSEKGAAYSNSVKPDKDWSPDSGVPMPPARYARYGGNHCPNCDQNDSIETGELEFDSSYAWYKTDCSHCNASWTDTYQLTGTLI